MFFVGILSASDEKRRNRIRIRKSVEKIRGSGSVPKCHGSTTLFCVSGPRGKSCQRWGKQSRLYWVEQPGSRIASSVQED
jgi:hypothetical protein